MLILEVFLLNAPLEAPDLFRASFLFDTQACPYVREGLELPDDDTPVEFEDEFSLQVVTSLDILQVVGRVYSQLAGAFPAEFPESLKKELTPADASRRNWLSIGATQSDLKHVRNDDLP